MPSGHPLTDSERARILKLAGLVNLDGAYSLKYKQIAQNLDISEKTVYRVIRDAGVKWGKYTAQANLKP